MRFRNPVGARQPNIQASSECWDTLNNDKNIKVKMTLEQIEKPITDYSLLLTS